MKQKPGFSNYEPVKLIDALSSAGTLANLGSDRILPRQVATGTYRGQQTLDGQKVLIDSSGGRIIISDDNGTRRFLAGSRSE